VVAVPHSFKSGYIDRFKFERRSKDALGVEKWDNGEQIYLTADSRTYRYTNGGVEALSTFVAELLLENEKLRKRVEELEKPKGVLLMEAEGL
jgi:hypothetical protein